MAKIFSFNHNNYGTLRDSISSILGIASGGSFKKTSKGYSYYLESGDSISYTGLSFDLIDLITECRGIGTLRITIGATNNDIVLTDNIWSFEKDTFALTSQTTVTITVISGFAYISRIFGFDNSLSTIEENNLQIDFLRNKGTGSSIYKNPNPIKATDLSRFDNIVAAYNCIISTGQILVDVSHNSKNIDLNSGIISRKNGIWLGNNTQAENIGNIKSMSFRFKAETLNDKLFEGSANNDLIYNNAGTLVHPFDVCYINGLVSTSIPTTGEYYTVTLTSATNLNFSAFSAGINNVTKSSFELIDLVFYDDEVGLNIIKQHHNQFVNPVIIEDFQRDPVNEFPREWQKDSGEFEVKENTTGNKYCECTSDGIIKILYKDTLSGIASIGYYDGVTLVTVTDVLSTLISTYSWLSHDGQYLKFTLTTDDYIDNIIIKNGIKQL